MVSLIICSCSSNKSYEEISGKVIEIGGNYVEFKTDNNGRYVVFLDNPALFKIGDNIIVHYSGSVMDVYPLRFTNVIKIIQEGENEKNK